MCKKNFINFDKIRELAFEQGFCDVGATELDKVEGDFFEQWLAKGYNASMQYMENYLDLRKDPRLLSPNSCTMFCFLMSYNDERVDNNSQYKIASYAQRKDYHYTIKEKLRNIISKIEENIPSLQAIAFVDSAPILERYWAEKCGLGWKGKNSLLVTKEFGSKVFIGEILCNISTNYPKRTINNHCGTCTRCIDSCPNHAIKENKEIDCNLCISYQTIENKEPIPNSFNTNNYIYGCDLCLEACPWNKKAKKIPNQDTEVKELVCTTLEKIEQNKFEKGDFNKLKKQSPINRIKYEKLLSNIQACRTTLPSQPEQH